MTTGGTPEDPTEERAPRPPVAPEFTDAEKEVLEFLRTTKRVDMRWLSDKQKQRLFVVLDGLHNGKKLSLLQISKEVGKSYTKIWGIYDALKIPVRTVGEANTNSAGSRTKNKRTPFDGSPEEAAYMLGFKNGDITAWQVSGTAVMVTSTTTHPAFSELFHRLFEKYGHIYHYPMFDKDHGYKWKVATRLDNTFAFLIDSPESSLQRVLASRPVFMSWLSGIVDSDGHIRVSQSNEYARVILSVYSTNKVFLSSLKEAIERFGYHFDGPYLTAEKGDTTPKGITYQKDFWNIALQRNAESQDLLQELPVRHLEKIERKQLALSIEPATRWKDVEASVSELRMKIREQVKAYVREAESAYLQRQERKRQQGRRPVS